MLEREVVTSMVYEGDVLHRYTDLPALLYLLRRRKFTMLNPASWDDKNDSYFLLLYKRARRLSCLDALCFTEADETYHHWRVFAGGAGGIRVTFEKSSLLQTVSSVPEIRGCKVEYKLLKDIKGHRPEIAQLPFLKRYPYGAEDEYRLIYESGTISQAPVDVDLPLNTIRRVTLSPWMNARVASAVKEILRSIPGCTKLPITHSTLIGNDDWMAYGNAALGEDTARLDFAGGTKDRVLRSDKYCL
jgi:hypothetical protein